MGKFDPVFEPELKKYDSSVRVQKLSIQSIIFPIECYPIVWP